MSTRAWGDVSKSVARAAGRSRELRELAADVQLTPNPLRPPVRRSAVAAAFDHRPATVVGGHGEEEPEGRREHGARGQHRVRAQPRD